MRYHLYYHDDFDGMASGAVLLNFLHGQGDSVASFNPIDYTPKINEMWTHYKFKTPFILVDFRYHPKASWWFDHHKSSFTKPALPAWGRMYKNDKTHFCNPNFASCASLILAHLVKHFGYSPPKHIKELVRWDDIIDGAQYKSLAEAIESRNPALKIKTYVHYEKSKKYRINLIKKLSVKSMEEVITNSLIKQKVKVGLAEDRWIIKQLKKISLVYNKLVFVDGVKSSLEASHFMAYYAFPFVKYSVILEKMSGGYHLGVGFNRWQKAKRNIDINKLMEKYGGGGHATVGAVELKSKKEIMKIAGEVIEYLNKHG